MTTHASPTEIAVDRADAKRMGFFTDTTVCIGCKACETACKQWNQLPDDGMSFTGTSYDNTGELGASTWRHVAFVEHGVPAGEEADREGLAWLFSSDVCNGCGYCIVGCPFGVIDRREEDGRAWKCTLCYDRTRDGLEPACAKACPTDSIQYGDIEELRARAEERLATLQERGASETYLYGAGEDGQPGTGGLGAFSLLAAEPEVYGLPPDPVAPARRAGTAWAAAPSVAAAPAAPLSQK